MKYMTTEDFIIKKFYDYVHQDFPNTDLMINVLDTISKAKFKRQFLIKNGRDIRDFILLLDAYVRNEFKEIDRKKVIVITAVLLYLTEPDWMINDDTPGVSSHPDVASSVIDSVYNHIEENIEDFWMSKFSDGHLFSPGEFKIEVLRKHDVYAKKYVEKTEEDRDEELKRRIMRGDLDSDSLQLAAEESGLWIN